MDSGGMRLVDRLGGDPDVAADQDVTRLSQCLASGVDSLGMVPRLLKSVLRTNAWRARTVRKTGEHAEFSRFEDFVTTRPLKGLGATMDLVRKLIRDDPEALDMLDRVTVAPAHVHRDRDNRTVSDGEPDRGTSRQYALRKLRRSAPEIHARVLAGELSPHAGMIAAGFRRKATPLDVARRAWRRMSHEERRAFLEEVSRDAR